MAPTEHECAIRFAGFLVPGQPRIHAGAMSGIWMRKRRYRPRHRKPSSSWCVRIRSRRTALLTLCAAGIAFSGLLGGLGAAHAALPRPHQYSCDRGTFCFWNHEAYGGDSLFLDLRAANPGDCVPLAGGVTAGGLTAGHFTARSLANRSGRDLVVFDDPGCSPDTRHVTYPGGGTFVPETPFDVTAIRVEPTGRANRAAAAHQRQERTDAGFPTRDIGCTSGRFCYWPEPDFPGKPRVLNLSGEAGGVCIPFAFDDEARAFVNNSHYHVTLYQDGHCGTNGEFRTYPGGGTYVPESPYVVRAIEVWKGDAR